MLSKDVEDWLGPARFERINTGESGTEVLRVHRPHQPVTYLKIADGWQKVELQREGEVLTWLEGRCGAPLPLHFAEQSERAYLLLSEVAGETAADLASRHEPKALLTALALGLGEIHRLPHAACPFPRHLDQVVDEAPRRAHQGLVDLTDLDSTRQGWSIEQLLAELDAKRPADEDLVFVHGDFSLPNLMLRDGKLIGAVDWSRAGVADRYQDIALLLRSFEYNTGSRLEPAFCAAYGIPELDYEKIRFYQLLDEFF